MACRIVRPAPSSLLGGSLSVAANGTSAPLDFEGLLRHSVAAVTHSLDEDTLEAIACTACEVLGDCNDASGGSLNDQRGALVPALASILEDAAVAEDVQSHIIEALLAAASGADAGANVTGTPDAAMPRLSSKEPPAARAPSDPSEEFGPKYRRRGEVERARAAEYLREHEEQKEIDKARQEAREQDLRDFYHVSVISDREQQAHGAPGAFNPAAAAGVTTGAAESSSDSEQDEEDEATKRERETVKHRLRLRGEPATFFGESDDARTARLNELELIGDQDVLASGSRNILQMVSRQAQRGINVDKDEEDFHVAGARAVSTPVVPLPALVDIEGVIPPVMAALEEEDDDDAVDLVDEAAKAVSLWIRNTLREWETELTRRHATEKDNRLFTHERGQFRQSKQYLRPLRKALRDGSISPGIVGSLQRIADACESKMYKEAKEAYMKLAIGNQPWPIGVTTVTFHDRPNRHNIGEDNVAHILNDETTRKYVQMIKRLLTYAEGRWPIDPSRAA
jgi:pre-mRNA-splicing factor 18